MARPDVHGLFLLNSTASNIWIEFKQGRTTPEISRRLAADFGISGELARKDTESTLSSWRSGLLAPSTPSSPSDFLPLNAISDAELCSIHCTVNGRSLRVLLEPGEVADEIVPRIEPLRTEPRSAQCTYTVRTVRTRKAVFRDDVCIGDEENAAGARAILLQAMVTEDPAAILHAGGCGGILLAGQSHSGKTTLCAALLGRGLPYYCDDSAILDREFRITQMPFPLALREGSWPLLDAQFPALRDVPVHSRYGALVRFLLPEPAGQPGHAKALVFVAYAPSAETRMTPVGELASLLALQRSGFWVEHTEQGIARFLEWLRRTQRFELVYSNLEQAIETISGLAEESVPERGSVGTVSQKPDEDHERKDEKQPLPDRS